MSARRCRARSRHSETIATNRLPRRRKPASRLSAHAPDDTRNRLGERLGGFAITFPDMLHFLMCCEVYSLDEKRNASDIFALMVVDEKRGFLFDSQVFLMV